MNGYDLSKAWFTWCGDNRKLINPNHHALYFWIVEKANSLIWSPSFGLPSGECMHYLGINSYKTYIKTFDDLEKFGFIKVVERSKNQYTTNIIELVNFTEAQDKASPKQVQSKGKAHTKPSPTQSDYNKTFKPLNLKTTKQETVVDTPEQKNDEEPEEEIEQQQKGFDLAGKEREEFKANLEKDKLLDIPTTKEYLLNETEVWRMFRQWTNNTEREIFEKVLNEFLKVETGSEGLIYPRPKGKSLFHFQSWTKKRVTDKKELFKIQVADNPVKTPTEEEKAEERRLSREKLDAYTASLKAKKNKMDEATALNRKTKENELRQLSKVSANISAKSISSYLLP